MQQTSALWQTLFTNPNHIIEMALIINGSSSAVPFGNDGMTYGESYIIGMQTNKRVFSGDLPEVGCCIAGEIDLKLVNLYDAIPRMARLSPFVRVRVGDTCSEWIQKGVFFIDTREKAVNDDGIDLISIHGFDAMLKTEVEYPTTTLSFPALDINVVNEIASAIGCSVDARTTAKLTSQYMIPYPAQYTMRETLSYIGMMYAGNWIINDVGKLQLIQLNDLPAETNRLINEVGYYITFGGYRILV